MIRSNKYIYSKTDSNLILEKGTLKPGIYDFKIIINIYLDSTMNDLIGNGPFNIYQ